MVIINYRDVAGPRIPHSLVAPWTVLDETARKVQRGITRLRVGGEMYGLPVRIGAAFVFNLPRNTTLCYPNGMTMPNWYRRLSDRETMRRLLPATKRHRRDRKPMSTAAQITLCELLRMGGTMEVANL